ncbi:nuclear transcription factor Y subunit beta [Drosophila eugracilis]|uniref:nuclear transcription factor Y subunit beta n=1 Tax=Drosophila eugracilis TaxID=29029 RepID=UPI0007E60600|nr:nuclear transcription factor Y subunit beta [Drosophila eugracilis]
MDAKRGNASGARQSGSGYHASKTSVASRHGGGVGGGVAVAQKQASQVSLTPSQARNPENPRKSPLDALSRSGNIRNQNPFQRRSGLQDVDESFLASNAFARPPRVRHSGLERENVPQVAAAGAPAGQQGSSAMAPVRVSGGQDPNQQQQQQYQQMPPVDVMQQQQQMPPSPTMPLQQQTQQPYIQPAAGQPTRMDPVPSGRARAHQQQVPHQQQIQQQQQMPPQTGYEQQQQPQVIQPDAQMQSKFATQQHQLQPQHQMSQHGYPAQPPPAGAQQTTQPPAGGAVAQGDGVGNNAPSGGAAAPPDAEMCTTCPNCQTTIYLVRSPELGHGDAGLPVQ